VTFVVRAGCAISFLLCAHCGLAAGLPPVQAQIGGTGRGSLDAVDVQTKLALDPLAAMPELHRRRVDVGVGWAYDQGKPAETHAAYLDVGAYPVNVAGPSSRKRIGVHGLARWLPPQLDRADGYGVGVQLTAEVLTYAYDWSTTDDDGFYAGAGAVGELGIGAYAEAGWTWIGTSAFGSAALGLLLRVPLSGFYALVISSR
jgi:hypothetical protein